jgi:hypothetical protein
MFLKKIGIETWYGAYKFDGVLNKENWNIVSDYIPVSFLRI